MSIYQPMTTSEKRKFNNFFSTGDFNKPKPRYTGNWTLYYGELTWPEATNKPIAICQKHKKLLLRSGYVDESKFKFKQA